MKEKRIFLFWLVLTVFSLSLSGCNTPKPLPPDQANPVLQFADPMADRVLAGMVEQDYAKFSTDFDEVMKNALAESNFTQMIDTLTKQLGAFQTRMDGRGYLTNEGDQQFYTVVYPTKWEKATISLRLSFHVEEPHSIAGLYFR